MNIVVFGATGATGCALIRQALVQKHHVTALARTPAKLDIKHSNLKVVQGDVSDTTTVESILSGHDAVCCVLGNATPLKRDPALVRGLCHIVRAMERSGPSRLIYLSFLGVPDGRSQLTSLFRYVIAPLLLRNEVADHEAKENAIKQCRLEWTIVRPPKLTDGPPTGTYRHGCSVKGTSIIPTISRADVADFMLRQLDDRASLRRAPAVMH